MKKFSPSDLERLAQIVHEETGNQVLEKNHSMIENRMRVHFLKIGIPDIEAYWDYFAAHEEQERDMIQGLMTTHYTFFFREFAHFEALGQWIQAELPRLKKRFEQERVPVRIWSAAASRGQEAYSICMFLEENLRRKHGIEYEVVGTDIDAKSVAYAQNGVYHIREVNTIPQHYLSDNWKRGRGTAVDYAAAHTTIRSRVRFETLNLLETPQWKESRKFDVIFCRNVFIYFSEENIRKIALDLAKRLDPEGLFISGLSEPLRFTGWNLQLVGPSVYRAQAPKTAAAPAEKKAPALSVVAEAPKKYRVLCVDDSSTIQNLLRKIFSTDPNCQEVQVAANGREAREKLDKSSFDLITLDIHMPEVSGIDFLEKLYRKNQDPPVVMISSVNRTDQDLAMKALTLGAADYVEKPAMNTLQRSTDEILGKAKMILKQPRSALKTGVSEFDASISQKVSIPDASQCARVVFCSKERTHLLQQVLKGQSAESRSPVMLLVMPQFDASLEQKLKEWTPLKVARWQPGAYLSSHQIYLVEASEAEAALSKLPQKSVSLQALSVPALSFAWKSPSMKLQILFDERLKGDLRSFETKTGQRVSDLVPATSFPSLSVEFFAKLRKAA